MERERILVVDDEQDICDILQVNLELSGYDVDTACSAEEALCRDIAAYHIILLDIMMPGISGLRFANMLKDNEHTAHIPIIFITAKDTEDDIVEGFDTGADDYIQKPFSVREVTARVKAVVSRSKRHTENTGKNIQNQVPDIAESIVSYDTLIVDTTHKSVSVDGTDVAFTPTEYHLLLLLITNRRHVFSREELIERVWRSDVIVTFRTVDVNIRRIRKKIGRYASHIMTRQGFGYYFE